MPAQLLFRRAAALTASAVMLLGCSADEVTAPTATALTADLDGVPFVAEAMSSEFSLYDNGTRLLVVGVQTTGDRTRQLAVDVGGWRGVGTYAIDSNIGIAFIVLNEPLSGGPPTGPTSRRWETKTGDVGELVITQFDEGRRRIAGTFRFRAENASGEVIEVANGSFSGTFDIDP